jgi:hypothetical protein
VSDFALDNGGIGYDMAIVDKPNGKRDYAIVRGRPAIAQRVQMRTRTFLGESRYNRLAGMPWTQAVFVKGVNATAARAIMEQHVLNTQGVKRVDDMSLTFVPRTRVLSGTARIVGDDGDPLDVPIEIAKVLPPGAGFVP